MSIQLNKVAIEPKSFPAYEKAVIESGCVLASLDESVGALIWTDYGSPQRLAETIAANPQLTFVQLPFAGVDAFSEVIQLPVRFACAKGSYREPVAEHAMALALSLSRIIPERVLTKTWGRKFADSIYDAKVVIVGGGGITEELVKLLTPFRAEITVVRNRDIPFAGVSKTVGLESLNKVLGSADYVFLACSLTDKTKGLFDLARFKMFKQTAYFINIARGPIVVTNDLVEALNTGLIAGAGVDVTDPEPLPDGHPLWSAANIIITPHSADTNAQVIRLFSQRIKENLAAYRGLGQWSGLVDPELGY
jgi:phosphoglycerate dehydrogenase-like enzyme